MDPTLKISASRPILASPVAPRPPAHEVEGPRDLATLSGAERAFVENAVADPKFGPKNAYILRHYFGYPVARPVDPKAFVPPPPVVAPPGTVVSDPALVAKARSFDQIVADARASGGTTMIPIEGIDHAIQVSGLSPDEVSRVTTAIDAIPPGARGFLQSVKEICVANFEAFKAPDGSASELTTGVAEADSGQLLLNRKWLDFESLHVAADADEAARKTARDKDDAHWQNTLLHELGHFEDRWLQRGDVLPSREPSAPLGNHGVWYTDYAWRVQDPAEDLAEGYALLGQARWKALHPPNR